MDTCIAATFFWQSCGPIFSKTKFVRICFVSIIMKAKSVSIVYWLRYLRILDNIENIQNTTKTLQHTFEDNQNISEHF